MTRASPCPIFSPTLRPFTSSSPRDSRWKRSARSSWTPSTEPLRTSSRLKNSALTPCDLTKVVLGCRSTRRRRLWHEQLQPARRVGRGYSRSLLGAVIALGAPAERRVAASGRTLLRWGGSPAGWPGFSGGSHPALAHRSRSRLHAAAARDPAGSWSNRRLPPSDDTLIDIRALSARIRAQVALRGVFGLVTGGVLRRRPRSRPRSRLPVAVLIGKPLGLFAGVVLARALGLHLPFHVGWRELVVVGCLATIGFTMALFFATVSVGPARYLSDAQDGRADDARRRVTSVHRGACAPRRTIRASSREVTAGAGSGRSTA